jgi:hypothetical protein
MIPLQGFAPGLIGEMLRRQPISAGKIALAWQLAVGTQIARATEVEMEQSGAAARPKCVLHVRARDARWAKEVERARATLVERLKPLLGVDKLAIDITTESGARR